MRQSGGLGRVPKLEIGKVRLIEPPAGIGLETENVMIYSAMALPLLG
jgi:hypothetical protein